MDLIIIRYILILLLIVAVIYFLYLIKERDFEIIEEYYGIENNLLNSLIPEETNKEVLKIILQEAAKAVKYIEDEYKNENDIYKEEKALELFKENLKKINIKSKIEEDNLKYIIRIATTIIKNIK